MRINESVAVLWRGANTVQLELGPRRIVVENVGTEQLLALMPARRVSPRGSSVSPASAVSNVDPAQECEPELSDLRRVLDRSGFMSRSSTRLDVLDQEHAEPAHLLPDLSALTGAIGSDARSVLMARHETAIAVHGTSRLAVSIAATLAAAGVGWVQLVNGGDVSAADACPGGLAPSDEGRRFGAAAADAIRRAAPDVDTTPIPYDRRADLVVLTDPGPIDSAVRASLHLDGLAHLSAEVSGLRAIVGPLVLPGVTSCLRCADLHRTERDPAWPALAVQLSGLPKRRRSSDVALCVATAGLTASQALAYLDRQHPATVEGTLEWQLPDWRLRRRSWPPHHACDCGASAKMVRAGQNGHVSLR